MRVTHPALRITAAALAVALSASPAIAAKVRRGPTSPKSSSKASASSVKKGKSTSHASAAPKGPRSIDDARAMQIQKALIKAGYMTGEPSGHWDSASEAAMEKLQGDNGWQTKLVPDSRALIKLGLGPGGAAETTATTATTNSTTASAPAKNE